MITRLIWTIWTPMSSVPKKADKLNLSLHIAKHSKDFLSLHHVLSESISVLSAWCMLWYIDTTVCKIMYMELWKSLCDDMHWQQGKCYIYSWQFWPCFNSCGDYDFMQMLHHVFSDSIVVLFAWCMLWYIDTTYQNYVIMFVLLSKK